MESCVPQIPLALATPSLNRGVAFTHEERGTRTPNATPMPQLRLMS